MMTISISSSTQAEGFTVPHLPGAASGTSATPVFTIPGLTQSIGLPSISVQITTTVPPFIPILPPFPSPTQSSAPDSTEMQAQKEAVVEVLQGTMPQFEEWINGVEIDTKPIIEGFRSIEHMAGNLLKDITGGTKDGGCTHSLFGVLHCAIDTASKAVTSVSKGIKTGLKGTLDTLIEVTNAIPKLKIEEAKGNNDDQSTKSAASSKSQDSTSATSKSSTTGSTSKTTSTKSTSTTSSSTECTRSATVTNEHVTCSTTVIASTSTTTLCKTSQSIASGCSVTEFRTTTTLPLCSQTSTATNAHVTCSPIVTSVAGSARGTTWPCTTTSTVLSGCSITGTTTTTSMTASTMPIICAQTGCDICTRSIATSSPKFVPRDSNLVRRAMETPGDYENYDEFILAQFRGLGKDLSYVLPHRVYAGDPEPGKPHFAGATTSQAFPFRSTAFSTAVEGLFGCTSLIVVSTGGVFISHIFEDPTFLDGTKATPQFPNGLLADDAVWARDVRQAIFRGDTTDWVVQHGLARLTMNENIFDKETYKIFPPHIITPMPVDMPIPGRKPGDKWRYQGRIDQLKELIRVTMNQEAVIVPYDPLFGPEESREHMDKTARGKVLVQYDPKAKVEEREEKDPKTGAKRICSYQMAGLKIWVDTLQLVYEEYWDPHDSQKGSRVPVQTLIFHDDGPATSVPSATALSCRVVSSASSSTTTSSSHSSRTGVPSTKSTKASTKTKPSTSQKSTLDKTTRATTTKHTPTNTNPTTTSPNPKHLTPSCHITIIQQVTWSMLSTTTILPGGVACTCNNGQIVGLRTVANADGISEYRCEGIGGPKTAVSSSSKFPAPTSAKPTQEIQSPTQQRPPSAPAPSPSGCPVNAMGAPVCG
ncbi:hypothetical protein CB0940_08136 [Cercospora beticola]|uniref:Uncharacterized protein n=1 Tax=Cercospora beticola TaxID=122368 RepID=A0A2G5HRZ8_CERBT|nr:hypothetical protein CB0940_08136 [Cercospora beticola]PIA95073.1 hypothetical protein CB0940_08136 [Cercospora beticola]WPB04702.1 hypothetical protein RHO25_009349 [Cercospora beticola]